MEIFSFIPYFTEILTVVLAAHAVALAIVNLTETPKDNEAVEFVYKIIEKTAGRQEVVKEIAKQQVQAHRDANEILAEQRPDRASSHRLRDGSF